jgi:hypothetical protein
MENPSNAVVIAFEQAFEKAVRVPEVIVEGITTEGRRVLVDKPRYLSESARHLLPIDRSNPGALHNTQPGELYHHSQSDCMDQLFIWNGGD